MPGHETNKPASGGLDRSSFVPLYFQLAEILKERIEAAHWQPGDRFPSEGELREEFGVSRTVIRPALALLESDGQLVRLKGRGTFVSSPKRSVRITGLIRLLSEGLPDDISLRVVEARSQTPESLVANVLDTGSDPVTHITAVGSTGGRPLFICDSFSRPSEMPWLFPAVKRRGNVEPGTHSLGPIRLSHATVHLDVAYVSPWEATQLELAAGQSCYLLRAVQWGLPPRAKKPRPLEFARLVYPVDRVQLTFDLSDARPDPSHHSVTGPG